MAAVVAVAPRRAVAVAQPAQVRVAVAVRQAVQVVAALVVRAELAVDLVLASDSPVVTAALVGDRHMQRAAGAAAQRVTVMRGAAAVGAGIGTTTTALAAAGA